MSEVKIMIIRESIKESIIADTYMFGSLIASILVGWLLNSSALEWIAGIFFIVAIFVRAFSQQERHFTVAEARKKLDEIEASMK